VLLNDPAGEDDGLLQPQEIGQFRLNAGVVVLSACDTAVGPTLGQEGVLNIARAFLLADARSVITTLWAVSDVTSPSTSIVPSAGPLRHKRSAFFGTFAY
jgi:CHAT domain-containing protein